MDNIINQQILQKRWYNRPIVEKQILLRDIPQEVIDEYEDLIQVENLDGAISNMNKLNILFKRAVEDFESGKISIDDLSQIGYIVITNLEDINLHNTNLGTAAMAASELGCYSRQTEGNGYERMLKSVMEYAHR